MLVEVHPEATREIESAATWYASNDAADVANDFLLKVDVAMSRIGATPHRYPKHILGTQRLVLKRFPYSVVYRVLPDRVRVLAVPAHRQRPGYWHDRE